MSVARLDSAWIQWAEKNDAFEGVGDGRTLVLNTISFHKDFAPVDSVAVAPQSPKKENPHNFIYYLKQKQSLTNVRVLEDGINLRYLELTPNVYTFTWDDVAEIHIDRRPKTALSGIDCIYKLRSGETYEGQQAGETANTLSLYLPGGRMRSFNIDDVIKYTFHGINPDLDIFEQSQLLDVVSTTLGAPVRGIIIEQNYSSDKDSENYILIQEESGAIQSIKMSDYVATTKEENPRFKMLSDVILKEGEVMVNRKAVKYVNIKEENDVMVLDSLQMGNVIAKAANGNTRITVEYRAEGAANVEMFQLVKVVKTIVKKKEVYSFSYKDLVNAAVRPQEVVTSVNKTTKVEYTVTGQGVYALYDARKHRAIPLIVRP
ncbi:MAG: hypothetical protein IJ767_05425 [Bacteroidaceae bacterium]|nr:hypothetical protein [Bacteroidaceae bacterium]